MHFCSCLQIGYCISERVIIYQIRRCTHTTLWTTEELPVSTPISETIRFTEGNNHKCCPELHMWCLSFTSIWYILTTYRSLWQTQRCVVWNICHTFFHIAAFIYIVTQKLLQTESVPHQHVELWPIISHSITTYIIIMTNIIFMLALFFNVKTIFFKYI